MFRHVDLLISDLGMTDRWIRSLPSQFKTVNITLEQINELLVIK